MSVLRVVLLCLLAFVAALPAVAQAPARHALLIGNQKYTGEIGALTNPHNDVALLEGALKRLGFTTVTVVRDARLGATNVAINRYLRTLARAGPSAIGFFYYSGHGAADGATNYLIPVDATSTDTAELWDQSLRLGEITRRLKAEAGNATHFVVFDACRNTLKLREAGKRAVVQAKGFRAEREQRGMLISYATAEGELASDVGLGAGPYAKALAEEIVKPGVEAVTMFRTVQRRVRAAISQEPYLGFNALGDVYLAGKEVAPAAAAPTAPPTQALSSAAETVRVCREVETITSLTMLGVLQRQYRGTPAAECLAARVTEIKTAQATALKASETERKKAEAERALAELERKTAALAKPLAPPVDRRISRDAALSVGETFRDCYSNDPVENRKCPEMVVVPAGSFMMGSPDGEEGRSDDEGPQLRVTIAKPFAVGKFEVTFDEWVACVKAGGCTHTPADQGWGRGRRPVINVNWDDAKQYVTWLSKATGKDYRLLSEAEWEYVARAGTTTRYSWGNDVGRGNGNCDGCGSQWDNKQPAPVGSFKPNAFGLHDMSGNVWEWTEDCWNASHSGAPSDGSPRTSGYCSRRVLRGGSWLNTPQNLRSAYRFGNFSDNRYSYLGFRVARVISR